MMQKLEISEIIRLIQAKQTFEATVVDGSFEIKVNRYVPYFCTAIHNGNNLRPSLNSKIALDEFSRWYEEDPFTGDFIASMPITMIGKDSRYEYDLNRKPEECIHIEAWGKQVWKKTISTKEREVSMRKHANYYRVTHALVKQLESMFGGCVVYDLHAYNYKRWDRSVPLFNIGTERIDTAKYGAVVEKWHSELAQIKLANVENVTAINDVFFGRGYNVEYITTNFKHTLVLATEIKKVYCNELTGEDFPPMIKRLQQQLKRAIINNANFFSKDLTNWKYSNASKLLDRKIDEAVLKVDEGLYALLRNFELLSYVNPNNSRAEFKRFQKNHYTEPPKFKYNPIRINPFELKRELNLLRTQDIADVTIRHLYESVINSYFDKIDMLATLGTPKFLYNSLRYFGRPSKKDQQNAQYLMHLPNIPSEPKKAPTLDVYEAIRTFKTGLESYGFDAKMEISNKIIAKVMVLNSKQTIQFRPDAKYTRMEVNALVAHEIGVHMVTTTNSNAQNLKLFNIGLPVNTMTQEGLAILSEYLSGNLNMARLRKLAHRVMVVDMMCNGADFMECFHFLMDNYVKDPNEAFTIVTRIFRGGGFTKDYLYLSGFVKTLRMWENHSNMEPLLVGKASLEFYNTIEEMIEREMVERPKYVTKCFTDKSDIVTTEIYDYILSGLKA